MDFPQPEVGLVISYSYLWSDEAKAGHVEGRKNRPCAIVLVVQQTEGDAPLVTVVPITHSPHRNPDAAMEIPSAIRHHLGLDDQPSWIVLNDFNVFTWPGFDLRPIPGQVGRYDYGLLAPRLFESIIRKFSELRRRGHATRTSRDDETLP
jgi:hypothetical protein